MSPLNLYAQWAPVASCWSDWAKPVLFTDLTDDDFATGMTAFLEPLDMHHMPVATTGMAIVVDLPGVQSVQAGLGLAALGYRPVPLYNAAPPPGDVFTTAVVEVGRIRQALKDNAAALTEMGLPLDAPPCFLLDSLRRVGSNSATPGKFDNRWITFPEDYPSANTLKSKGISGIVVLQTEAVEPQSDLRHVLLRWQEAGLTIYLSTPTRLQSPTPITVSKPSDFGALWYRFQCLFGLRRNSAGGFGSIVPEPSQSTG
jgi:hypothetical protein